MPHFAQPEVEPKAFDAEHGVRPVFIPPTVTGLFVYESGAHGTVIQMPEAVWRSIAEQILGKAGRPPALPSAN